MREYKTSGSLGFMVDLDNQLTVTIVQMTGDDPASGLNQTMQADSLEWTIVPDIGQMAIWSEKRQQLTVLEGNRIIHVALEFHDNTIKTSGQSCVAIASKILSVKKAD